MSSTSRDSASPSLSDSLSSPFSDKHGENSCERPSPSPNPSHQAQDAMQPPEGKAFIKRPLNPYMCWVVMKRKEVTRKNPKMKMSDVNAMLGDMWKKLTDEERKPFFEQSYKSREEHKVLMNENPHLIFKPVVVKKKKEEIAKAKQEAAANATNNANSAAPSPAYHSTPSFNGFKAPSLPQNGHHYLPNITPGTTVAQALGVRVPGHHQHHQQHHQAPVPNYNPQPQAPQYHQLQPPQPKQPSLHHCLEQYYTSLCQPAFPQSGDIPPGQHTSNFLWDQCQQVSMQTGHYL